MLLRPLLVALAVLAVAWRAEAGNGCSEGYDPPHTPIAGIPFREFHVFDDRDLGVQLRLYDDDGLSNLSYIRYDDGHATVDDAQTRAMRQQVLQDIVTVDGMRGIVLEGPKTLEPFAAGAVGITNDVYLGQAGNRVVVEFLGTGHDATCLHEIRYTAVVAPTAEAIDAARAAYRRILDELVPYISGDWST